jgi:acetylglutamate kinase
MGQRILLKIGGKAFEGESGVHALGDAIREKGPAEVIIVHGGGNEISQALKEANRETVFIDGIRATPAEDMRIVEAVLSGTVNERIAMLLSARGVSCRRLSGKTRGLFLVEPLTRGGQNLGYVGRITQVNPSPVLDSLKDGQIPVVSPVSANEAGESYNVNADSAAAALAIAAQCTDLVYFTDVPGVRVGETIPATLTLAEGEDLISEGTIQGGMVAKMESAFEALRGSVERVHITQWQGQDTLLGMIHRKSLPGTTIKL